ncbi:MAG: glycosyltransferase family 39 protein [Synergistaceae bacterium]|nr:glycosyltransferase family 39 protein [Synergistaceae bacterium]
MTLLFAIIRALFILFGLFLFAMLLFRDARGQAGSRTAPIRAARKTACLVSIALVYLFFRGIGDHGLLDPIEGINASVALNMAIHRNFTAPVADGQVYLGNSMGYWWLSALSLSVLGWSEFSVRLWSVIGGLGMAAAGWFIALRTGGERSANYAAVLIGSSLLVYAASQLASPHALYAFCVTMGLLGAIYAFRDKRFFILLHVSAVLAFVVYGPAGVVLPWLSLLVHAVLAGQERFFAKALFYWPGLLAAALIGGGYIFFLKARNPYILTLMRHNIPGETFYSFSSVLCFLAVGFIPWLGVLPGAVSDAIPPRWWVIPPGERERQNSLLFAWSAVFLFFGALSRDALLLVAPIPAMGVLCANRLARAAEKGDSRFFQDFAALEIALLVPFIFAGLPWFYAGGNKELRYTLISVIPWAVFCLLFLLAGWQYARTRQPRKLMLHMSMLSLFSLLPLAGIFDLMGERLSVRDTGLYLRNEMKQGDVLLQYALNHPSLSFYVGRPDQAPTLAHVAVNQKILGQAIAEDADLNRMWEGSERVFMLIGRHQAILTPLPRAVYNLHETRGVIVLSNQSGNEPPPATGASM